MAPSFLIICPVAQSFITTRNVVSLELTHPFPGSSRRRPGTITAPAAFGSFTTPTGTHNYNRTRSVVIFLLTSFVGLGRGSNGRQQEKTQQRD